MTVYLASAAYSIYSYPCFSPSSNAQVEGKYLKTPVLHGQSEFTGRGVF